MRKIRTRSILFALAGILVAAQMAGSQIQRREPDNKGGVLYFSLAPELRYADTTSYRGLSLNPRPDEAMVTAGTGKRPQVAYLLAAFPREARPELSVVTFGIRYPKGIRVRRCAITPPCLQMATRDWPASGEGMMFGLTDGPDTMSVVELGWFAFEADVPGLVEIIPHPDPQNAIRVVAANPPVPIPISDTGALGFGMPGRRAKPDYPGPQLAASCSYDSVCIMLTRDEAAHYGKRVIYLGDGTDCIQGALCRGPMIQGACCLPDGTCKTLSNKECGRCGGTFRGNYTLCDTVRCVVQEANPSERKGR